MKVILKKDIKGLGRQGDVKEVNDGYARNFLLPQGLVEPATEGSVSAVKMAKNRLEKNVLKNREQKIKLAKKINRRNILICAKADDNGTLYAGLDRKFISAELARKKIIVSPEEIILTEKIKKIGIYDIKLDLEGKKATIKLEVTREK